MLTFGLLMSSLFQAFGQEKGQYAMDTINIQSLRVPQSISQTGRHITILQADDIARLPAHSLDELLRFLPGIEIQSRSAFGAQGDIIMRGSSFSNVLVLIDGMRVNDPLTGHFNHAIPIPMHQIERIEVLKGPAAAMYGPDAVGGLIHIISKAFADQGDNPRLEGIAEAGAGQFGLLQGQLGLQSFGEKIQSGIGIQVNKAEGQLLPTDRNNDFDIRTLSANLGLHMGNDWHLRWKTAFDQRTFNAQYFYTRSTFDESREQTGQFWTQLRLSHEGEGGPFAFDISYRTGTDSFQFNPAFPANIHTTGFLNAQLTKTWKINDQLSLNTGLQGDRRSIESTDRGNHEALHAGVFVVGAYQPTEALSLTPSLRLDADQNYGVEVLPQLSVSFRQPGWLLRGMAGKSIRAGDFTERFVSNLIPALTPGRSLGNPDLLAERAWTYEVGTDLFPVKGLRISSTLFYRAGSNMIDYILTNADSISNNGNLAAGEDYFYAQNLEQVNTYGFDVEIQGTFPLKDDLSLRALVGYSRINSTNPAGALSKYIANHAGHLANGNLQLVHPKFNLGIVGLYKNRDSEEAAGINAELVPSYFVLDLTGAYFIKPSLSMFFQVHNLTNTQYADILGAKMPDRWIMAGLRYRLTRK